MILIAVIAFWLSVLGYIPFHFRKTEVMKDTLLGFTEFWSVILKAKMPETIMDGHYQTEAVKTGIVLGICSLAVVALVILCFAIYTIYLACLVS